MKSQYTESNLQPLPLAKGGQSVLESQEERLRFVALYREMKGKLSGSLRSVPVTLQTPSFLSAALLSLCHQPEECNILTLWTPCLPNLWSSCPSKESAVWAGVWRSKQTMRFQWLSCGLWSKGHSSFLSPSLICVPPHGRSTGSLS